MVEQAQIMVPKRGAPMEKEAHFQSLLYIFFRVPSKGALAPSSLVPREREREREMLLSESTVSQSPRSNRPTIGSPTGNIW